MSKLFDFCADPKVFWLTLNRACNFRCLWCYADGSEYKGEDTMTFERAVEIVDLACEMGVKRITLIGGGPTFWPYLFKLNDYCQDKDIDAGIVTNAYLFGDNDFWRQYRESPCKSIGISIKGVTAEHFTDFVKAPALFNQTMLGVERAIKMHPESGVSMVFSSVTSVGDVMEIATVAKSMGAQSFMLSLCTATLTGSGTSDQFMVEPERLTPAIIGLHDFLDRLYDGKITLEMSMPLCLWPRSFVQKLFEKDQIMSICHVQTRSGLVFDTNDDVLPCNSMLGNYIASWSDFTDAESLRELLNASELRDNYVELLRYPAECCSECALNESCRGGCVVNWTVMRPDLCRAF